MSQLPPITDAYIDEIIKAPDAYNPSLNKTQGVKLRELIKKMRDFMQVIQPGFNEQNFATITERDAYNVEKLPFQAFVNNDGDGNWALYRATSTGVGAGYLKISDPDLLNAVMSSAAIKTAYESNANTNAFTDSDKIRIDAIAGKANSHGGNSFFGSQTIYEGDFNVINESGHNVFSINSESYFVNTSSVSVENLTLRNPTTLTSNFTILIRDNSNGEVKKMTPAQLRTAMGL
jgi:hypothetical protein